MENLKRILGMLDDEKRIYRFHEEKEVQREEFHHCQLIHELVFGDRGFVETLGPTWNMIHDPRFSKIENQFVRERRAIFGGDAKLGRQYVDDDGTFTSTVTDLEQYAEMLGEGRNFHNVLLHPDKDCQQRRWLERIYTGYTLVRPHLSLGCTCEGAATSPTEFYKAPDEDVWELIRQECPNRAFDQQGKPTPYGTFMFGLIRSDLIGLIHDYAETPLIDSYIYLRDNGIVVSAEEVQRLDPHGVDHQRVLQEIDILEQALSHRATLRLTATKVLKNMGFEQYLKDLDAQGKKAELTDIERDELLRIVYTSDWPENKASLRVKLAGFIAAVNRRPLAERQNEQLATAKEDSQATVAGLMDGTVLPINHYTEPVLEIPESMQESEVMRYAAMLDSLTKNPLKAELFQVYVAAEQEGEHGVLDLLAPIFDPNYELDEEAYFNFLRAVTRRARSLRVMDAEEVVPRGTVDTGSLAPKLDIEMKDGRFDFIGQRENPDKPGTWQVQLRDGTWHDTKFPDPPKEAKP